MDNEVKQSIFEEFRHMITTESVVGEPIYIGDATIIPFVDISFGFGTGRAGADGRTTGGAGGGKVTPTAVLIMKGERVELFSIRHAGPAGTVDKILNMVPEVISRFHKKKEDAKGGIAEEAAAETAADKAGETAAEK